MPGEYAKCHVFFLCQQIGSLSQNTPDGRIMLDGLVHPNQNTGSRNLVIHLYHGARCDRRMGPADGLCADMRISSE